MPVIRVYGYAYGLQSVIELRIGFYIYNNALGWCGVTSTGSWKPIVHLFSYTENGTKYVAVGLKGECYFCGFQVDVQAGALGIISPNDNYQQINPYGWTTEGNGDKSSGRPLTKIIPDVGVNDCIIVPYHSMSTDIDGNALSADKALNDSNGDKISDTYYKRLVLAYSESDIINIDFTKYGIRNIGNVQVLEGNDLTDLAIGKVIDANVEYKADSILINLSEVIPIVKVIILYN